MNLDWLGNPITVYGALAAGGAAALHLVISTKIEMRRQHKLYVAESEALREAVAGLEDRLRQVSVVAKRDAPPPAGIDEQGRDRGAADKRYDQHAEI